MKFSIEAACGCHNGKIRANNEDNFLFNNTSLMLEHNGLKNPVYMDCPVHWRLIFAVFDGMGGENFGEIASFRAASCLKREEKKIQSFFTPEKKYLKDVCNKMNEEVYLAAQEQSTEHMGTTMVSLFFTPLSVYVCNIGDSRAYRLRDGEFLQISQDHVEKRPDGNTKKAPLTQYLGMDPNEILIEPYIAKGELKRGDVYLLCSDGLTDMVSNFDICDILFAHDTVVDCVEALQKAAIENGGRDNITVIVCKVM